MYRSVKTSLRGLNVGRQSLLCWSNIRERIIFHILMKMCFTMILKIVFGGMIYHEKDILIPQINGGIRMKDRIETLKGYLKRLGNGEPLEAVRKDFVEVFKDVDPAEIMKAEQEMLAEGTPLSDVQKLCDVHAALFHGKTREEQIANAERAVHASTLREERETKTRELAQIKGHPLWLFANENGALAMLLEQAEEKIKDGSANKKTLESLRGISIHYAKKGDLLYPV